MNEIAFATSLLVVLLASIAVFTYYEHKKSLDETAKLNKLQIMQHELEKLIAATNGKFFSITFFKKDGTKRVVNGKDKYRRLLNGGYFNGGAGYVPFVDRNKEDWVSARGDKTVHFKCGEIEKTFSV